MCVLAVCVFAFIVGELVPGPATGTQPRAAAGCTPEDASVVDAERLAPPRRQPAHLWM
jgi:hypothetical protein